LSDIAHQGMVGLALTTEDIRRCKREGKVAFVVSIEGAAMIENELDRIDVVYGFGVRSLGICYSEANALGAGLKEPPHYGLTDFGRRAVERMNKLGIAIDVSHANDQTSLDTIAHSKHPVFITHAGARALWDTPRLKPDEVIKACAEKGGVIGIEAAPHTTITRNNMRHSLDSYMEHFEYCVDLVGIDHVAFGPDTLFGDHVGLHSALREALSLKASKGKEPYPTVEYVDGIENPAEAFPNVVRCLVTSGYSDDEIAYVIRGNVLRVRDELWARSASTTGACLGASRACAWACTARAAPPGTTWRCWRCTAPPCRSCAPRTWPPAAWTTSTWSSSPAAARWPWRASWRRWARRAPPPCAPGWSAAAP